MNKLRAIPCGLLLPSDPLSPLTNRNGGFIRMTNDSSRNAIMPLFIESIDWVDLIIPPLFFQILQHKADF